MDNSAIDHPVMKLMIQKAYTLAETARFGQSVIIARISEMKLLFPRQFLTSLTTLANLKEPSSQTTPAPSTALKIFLGLGQDYGAEIGLPDFFNDMLKHPQSENQILGFIEKGAALIITGGKHDNIVGAASYITMSDGLFIDLVVVSHGRHQNAVTFSGQNRDFQNQGLGTFLITLLCLTARVKCTVNPAVYLKANATDAPFFTCLGFVPLTSEAQGLPVSLASAVPAAHLDTSTDTVIFVRNP